MKKNVFACFGLNFGKSRHKRLSEADLLYAGNGSPFSRTLGLGRTPLLHKGTHLGTTPHGTPLPIRGTFRRKKRKTFEPDVKEKHPVKVLRPTVPAAGGQAQPGQRPGTDQLKRLEAELSSRTQEAQKARKEAEKSSRGLEALTVIVHYLTKEYDAFSSPKLKLDIERLTLQLTDVKLCLDETTANTLRLESKATERCKKHAEEVVALEDVHQRHIEDISSEHRAKTEEALEKHQQELKELIASEEQKHQNLVKSHKEELEKLDTEWRARMDHQHEGHLHALEQLNSCHTQQLREAEESWHSREKELEVTKERLVSEQEDLKKETKQLQETLLNDKDYRLQAVKRYCTALQNEVDSLKTVIEMRNSEVHKLRNQLADKERISEDLDAARERVRSLQAKTEDLNAQMEKKLQFERQLISEQHSLSESLQRESAANKRLTLENEELAWKLRQRDTAAGVPQTSTLDLVTRCSPAISPQHDGCKSGVVATSQFTPRSQRLVASKSQEKKTWSQSFSNIPEHVGKMSRRSELIDDVTKSRPQDDILSESPPLSPRVKAMIEKSNSVSFILDLNDTFPEDPFLVDGLSPASQGDKKPRTPKGQRKLLAKALSNGSMENWGNSFTFHSSGRVIPTPESMRRKALYEEMKRSSTEGHHVKNGDDRRHHRDDIRTNGDHRLANGNSSSNKCHQHVQHRPLLLQEPEEDEYEESEDAFVQVLTLGDDLDPIFGAERPSSSSAPSTSLSLSDSDISQCGSRAELSTTEDDDDEGTLLQKVRPQEGAGEAMIYPEHVFTGLKGDSKVVSSSAPSSDSDEANQLTTDEGGLNMSWSEDVEGDLTSSSEMQEIL